MVELRDFHIQAELLQSSEFRVHPLSPDIAEDRALGHASDIISLEAYNPEDMSHDAMKPKTLTRFLRGDERHMTRFLSVDPEKFFTYVDQGEFEGAIAEAKKEHNAELVAAFGAMKEKGLLGFVYMYNDENKGGDDTYRAVSVRDMQRLSKDTAVWEVNTGFVPGTKDKPVTYAVHATLDEFELGLKGDAAGIYFADAHDMKNAFTGSGPLEKASIHDIATNPQLLKDATSQYQDARVLTKLGFRMAGRMQYEPGTGWKDFIYGVMLRGVQK